MYPITFSQVAALFGKERSDQTQISKVIINSRDAVPACLFFALPGSKVDGHQFVNDVLQQEGYAVVKQGFSSDERVIEVADPLAALQKLAQFSLKQSGIPVIAVTGSNGKTTTKDFTAAVLQARMPVWKTQGNFNNELGLPLTIMEIEPHHEAVVLEMGMRGLGEIRHLTEIAPPQVAVITNVFPVHLELLGSIENIAAAKAEVLEGLKPGGAAVLNGDDPLIRCHAAKADQVLFFGKNPDNQLRAENIKVDQKGCVSYDLIWEGKSYPVILSVPGVHNVYNSLAGIGVGLLFGIPVADAIQALRHVELTEMRLEIVESSDGITIINDAYNASPASMRSALETLAKMQSFGRKIAVLGDMYELGPISDRAHEQVGEQAAGVCDLVIFVGQNAQVMRKGAELAGFPRSKIIIYQSVEQLLPELKDLVEPNDLVLIKASRSVQLERAAAVLKAR